jgi:hypothetical protein
MIVTGVPELDANLRALAGPAATRISKAALAAGMRVLAKAQKAAAPRGPTGATAASIGSRLAGSRGGGGRGGGGGGFKAKAGINVGRRAKTGAIVGSAKFTAHGSSGRRLSASARRARGAARTAPHAHLVALGTGPRYTGRSGLGTRLRRGVGRLFGRGAAGGGRGYRGKMPANPFIALTFAREAEAVKSAIRDAAARGIAREVNKLGKKTGQPVGIV